MYGCTRLTHDVSAGECFCLLGPNGAGKSTTIHCLTGVLPATAGEAVVLGTSITHQGGLDRVRGTMGVCPQFDVLWDTLTGLEHLLLFGAIKGLSQREAARQADDLLEQVRHATAGPGHIIHSCTCSLSFHDCQNCHALMPEHCSLNLPSMALFQLHLFGAVSTAFCRAWS